MIEYISMNSQNYYQSLLSDNLNEEINQYNPYPIYRNENDIDIPIMEFKESNDTTFSCLESSNFPKSQKSIYKNKKSNTIKKLISSLRKTKEDVERQKEKNEYYNTINLSRFFKPTYKKYGYMNYPYYKKCSSDTNK